MDPAGPWLSSLAPNLLFSLRTGARAKVMRNKLLGAVVLMVVVTTSSARANETSSARRNAKAPGPRLLVQPSVELREAPVVSPALLRLTARIHDFLHGPGPSVVFPPGGPLVQLRWTFKLDPVDDAAIRSEQD